MECGKDLAEGEKVLVIKEIAKVKTNKSIAERINRCVMTEIGEPWKCKDFWKNPSKRKPRSDRGGLNLFQCVIWIDWKKQTECLKQQAE